VRLIPPIRDGSDLLEVGTLAQEDVFDHDRCGN
jgi:hypothetical protein